jgi:flagellar hook protein FlgE
MPIPSLFTGAAALTNQQTAISVIANNIANVNTTAYKGSQVHFSEETNNIFKAASSPTAARGGTNPSEVGTGVRVSDINTVFTQGSLKNTGSVTDLAISGSGFFAVTGSTINGEDIQNVQYTRAGHFKLDADNNMVTATGEKVVAATLYSDLTQAIKSIDGYSSITYFTDQKFGEFIQATDGGLSPSLPIPTPSGTNVTGPIPSFDNTKISELSIRGDLIETTGLSTITPGDLTISRLDDGRFLFSYNDANAGTATSTFSIAIDPSNQILDGVMSFELTNVSDAKLQMRIRFEPGVSSFEDVFKDIDYDSVSGASDTLTFRGADTATQTGSEITVADDDFRYMSLSNLRSLQDTVKIPSFFYTVDSTLEVETASFTIDGDGTISIIGPSSEKLKLGRIIIANFTNPDGLINKGGNKYEESSNSGFAGVSVIGGPFDKNAPSITGSQIVSGALEASNVNLANEFAELIGFQRGLQANAKTITASDEILQTIINL